MKRSIFLSALFFFSFQFGYSQVQSVDYSLRYNSQTCLFDCFLIVNEGKTKNTVSRAQFNSQVSIVVPVTSNVFVEESYMPLRDNQAYRSSEPVAWEITNELEQPAALNESRIVSISPVLAPTAFYNDLKEGDEVKLFSIKVTPTANCAEGVRLFDNQKDPSSGAEGMMGADFSNGFTIGGVQQKYHANTSNVMPTGPALVQLEQGQGRGGLDFEFKTPEGALCQNSISYEFIGPKGKIGDLKEYFAHIRQSQVSGAYKVIATDNIGCSTEHTFYPFGREENNAVLNQSAVETAIVIENFESSIFPNPAHDVINLTVAGLPGTQVQGHIINQDGKIVKNNVVNTTLGSTEEVIKIETGLLPGMYTLSLDINKKERVNHKVLIVR